MPQPSNSRSFWTQLHPDQAVHQHQGLQGLFMGKDWLGLAGVTSIFHQFTSLHLSPLHFLGIRKNIWAALVLYLGPSRRLCSDISCFSPQKHLNCLKVPKNLRTFEDTHHSTNGIRTPAFTLRQVGCQLTRVPWGSIYSIGSGNMMFFMMIWFRELATLLRLFYLKLCAGAAWAGILLRLSSVMGELRLSRLGLPRGHGKWWWWLGSPKS